MSSLKNLYKADASKGEDGELANRGVDFVIDYRFATIGKAEAEAQFVKLINALSRVGLATEVRNGDNCGILIFVKPASEQLLRSEVYQSRVQDWLYGVRTAAPGKEMQRDLQDEPVAEAERLRLVYLLITRPESEGGAGITAKVGEWKGVESVFALHDHAFNKQWIKHLTAKYFLDANDFRVIRDRFGEKIAFYFSFLQSYFIFLTFPAGLGVFAWYFLGHFSPVYAVVQGLWGIVFIEYWKKQQADLAVQWSVRGVSRIQHKRPAFKHENIVKDTITGEEIKVYSPIKRLSRQLLQVPFAITVAAVLGGLIAGCFGIEIFISEVYDGPFKSYLIYLPTVILTTAMPALSALLTGFASWLTDLENYETVDAHESAMIQKVFVLNFVTSYLPIFLTAFVYVPFAQEIVPYLDVFQLAVRPFAEDEKQIQTPKAGGFHINPDRLKKQIIYFTVTAQVVNFALEVIMPYVKRKAFVKVKEVNAERAAKRGGASGPVVQDLPEESAFLKRVRNEAELESYDVTGDFREMIVQFGYLSLFSVIWPLVPLSFLINNWIELRGDALKIALETQRPVPWRADSIGPWLNCLSFLAWLGSLTSAALIYLFSREGLGPDGATWNIKGWGLLLAMFFSEHIHLAVQIAVRTALARVDSPGLQKERGERFKVRQQYLSESASNQTTNKNAEDGQGTRSVQAGTAHDATLQDTPVDQRFWMRQQGPEQVLAVGRQLITQAAPAVSKGKESKKEL